MVTASERPTGVDIRGATTTDHAEIKQLLDQLHPHRAADHRGAGVGTALLNRCQTWFDAAGADVVFVSAIDEAVIGFYTAAGFVRCTGPWLARPRASEKGDAA